MKGRVILIVVVILLVPLLIGLYELGLFKFLEPKRENIRREIFEQTQSYVHGKIQELAKYKSEYDVAVTSEDKNSIKQIILLRFAEFDETKITAVGLQSFLKQMRGY